ncbi:MAG: hypothetical protein QOK29_4126 [Rhodospirillaceae bacterium]|nr:hypothetical protein [Rhodospirillaceae bacterium]
MMVTVEAANRTRLEAVVAGGSRSQVRPEPIVLQTMGRPMLCVCRQAATSYPSVWPPLAGLVDQGGVLPGHGTLDLGNRDPTPLV